MGGGEVYELHFLVLRAAFTGRPAIKLLSFFYTVSTKYHLYAIVEHLWNIASFGHYSSYVMSAPQIWHTFDDAKGSLVPKKSTFPSGIKSTCGYVHSSGFTQMSGILPAAKACQVL